MSAPPSLSNSFDAQHALLLQESERKRQEIARLEEIGKKLTATRVNISQRAVEALSDGQLEQIDQLVTIAQKVQARQDRQEMEPYIQGLNTAVGTTQAQAVQLEEEVHKLEGTIEQMRQLVEERRKTVTLAKKVAEEINK